MSSRYPSGVFRLQGVNIHNLTPDAYHFQLDTITRYSAGALRLQPSTSHHDFRKTSWSIGIGLVLYHHGTHPHQTVGVERYTVDVLPIHQVTCKAVAKGVINEGLH